MQAFRLTLQPLAQQCGDSVLCTPGFFSSAPSITVVPSDLKVLPALDLRFEETGPFLATFDVQAESAFLTVRAAAAAATITTQRMPASVVLEQS